jgi:hypothetical protein
MTLYPGLIVRINKKVIASVCSENLNIISVRVGGDVISSEVATLDVTGGYYGAPEETRHLLWVTDHEILEQDEVEIEFLQFSENSHMGKTIEETFPEAIDEAKEQPQDINDLAEFLHKQPSVRKGFDICVRVGDAKEQVFEVREPNYLFSISAMWDWKSLDSAKLWVSSSTIQSIVTRQSGTSYLRQRMGTGQSVRIRIRSNGEP